MKIGIVTAMAEETLPICKKLGNVIKTERVCGAEISTIEQSGNTVYLATRGGWGGKTARVSHYQYDVSVLDNIRVGQYSENEDLYFYLEAELIERVNKALAQPLRKVAVASADAFVASTEKKKQLREEFGCDICEMELAGLAIACRRNELPLLSVKVISDKADDGAFVCFEDIVNKGLSRYEEILPAVLNAVTQTTK